MKYDPNVYGYVNGKPTYSRDEFIFTVRGFGPIENDADLLAFAEKETSRWYNAGWHQTFATYYLSDYALSEPGRSLTVKEFNRLKELQQAAREAEKAADDARCTVEVTVYRLNAVAVTAFLLDGPETLLRHIGLDKRDTYTTKHEIDDLVTVVHITREEAPAWQH